MPTFAEHSDGQNRKRKRSVAKTTGTFMVATVDPFTVTLDGSITAVPGLKVDGLAYTAGQRGVYFLRQGQKPLCIPTV